MQSSWTCTRTVTESSWCLTSPSSGKSPQSACSSSVVAVVVVTAAPTDQWTLNATICMGRLSFTQPPRRCAAESFHWQSVFTSFSAASALQSRLSVWGCRSVFLFEIWVWCYGAIEVLWQSIHTSVKPSKYLHRLFIFQGYFSGVSSPNLLSAGLT